MEFNKDLQKRIRTIKKASAQNGADASFSSNVGVIPRLNPRFGR